jgi:hypothetical protein
VYEGSPTLIAIGLQSGKVLIFNVLGLLVHEIQTDHPIIAIEWTGDMSAPSSLPSCVSSLSPEPEPVFEALLEDSVESEDEESRTVNKTSAAPEEVLAIRNQIQIGPDLFSDHQPPRRHTDVSNGSPLKVRRTRERPRMKSMIRPRIATETFRPPVSSKRPSKNALPTSSALPTPPIQDSRRVPQIEDAPIVPTTFRAHRFSASQLSSLSLSDVSQTSETEFFTPPSRRQDKGKAPLRVEHDMRLQPESQLIASPTSLTSSQVSTHVHRCSPSLTLRRRTEAHGAATSPHSHPSVKSPSMRRRHHQPLLNRHHSTRRAVSTLNLRQPCSIRSSLAAPQKKVSKVSYRSKNE